MSLRITFTIVLLVMVACRGDFNLSEYVFWQKAELWAWDAAYPGRVLLEEGVIGQAALVAFNSLSCQLRSALGAVVSFQAQEYSVARTLMDGTDAQGCIDGIALYMDKVIDNEIDTYNDCTADVIPKLSRLEKSWNHTRSDYLDTYQKALKEIDACAAIYPDKMSTDRLMSCISSVKRIYFSFANNTQNVLTPSPTMSYFQNTVVGCASGAARAVTTKGNHFLEMLLDCAALSGDIDLENYAKQLNQWRGYNDTLLLQISQAQTKIYNITFSIENYTQNHFSLIKDAIENHITESRGYDYYLSKMFAFLNTFYENVVEASDDYPERSVCTRTAKERLDTTANASATKFLSCDLKIVNTTKHLISTILEDTLYLSNILSSIGNAAILNCLSQGYIFAPNIIMDCFQLAVSEFGIEIVENQDAIEKNISVLKYYEALFSNVSGFPCEELISKRVFLEGKKVLYNLRRCLYIYSDTKYPETTVSTHSTGTIPSTVSTSPTQSYVTIPPTEVTTTTIPSTVSTYPTH